MSRTEVAQLRVAAERQQNVLGLQVAVDDVLRVEVPAPSNVMHKYLSLSLRFKPGGRPILYATI